MILYCLCVSEFLRYEQERYANFSKHFQVFEGDDGERFEKNWLYWTGARMLYR